RIPCFLFGILSTNLAAAHRDLAEWDLEVAQHRDANTPRAPLVWAREHGPTSGSARLVSAVRGRKTAGINPAARWPCIPRRRPQAVRDVLSGRPARAGAM